MEEEEEVVVVFWDCGWLVSLGWFKGMGKR